MVKSTGKELEEWKEAIQKELANMKGTLRSATKDEKAELDRLNVRPTPSRMVFVQKHTKKKARLVVCGQFLDPFGESNTSNLDAAPLRTLIASGWQKGKVIASMDITAAFLHAEMPKNRWVVIAPPAALVNLGLLKPDELWVVEKALYGLKESPKYWEDKRDKELRTLKLTWKTRLMYYTAPTPTTVSGTSTKQAQRQQREIQ